MHTSVLTNRSRDKAPGRAPGERTRVLVYRENSREVRTQELVAALFACMARPSDERQRLESFLRAAELECALADAGSEQTTVATALTDALCDEWLDPLGSPLALPIAHRVRTLELPDELTTRRPEGYAYYGLHPRGYAELAQAHPLSDRRVVVIGIRSIGASLSAVVASVLRTRGVEVRRITVRPTGHPWDRRLELDCFGALWSEAEFIVVDEGPGMSGSTFLSVGEALSRAGVPHGSVSFFCGRDVDPTGLVARDAAERWSRFRSAASAPLVPEGASSDWSAGRWRFDCYSALDEWPACWTAFERVKLRSRAGDLLKFEGLPPYDQGPLERAGLMYASGFGPRARAATPGLVAWDLMPGRPATRAEPRAQIIERLASYLCFRTRAMAAPGTDCAALELMTRVNVAEALGQELSREFVLECDSPVVVDGRLSPHEWIRGPDASLIKVDGVDHGDDHLFPGPCDIAWDLAGAIVEWGLDEAEAQALLRRFARLTSDDASARLPAYLIAYCAFRVGALSFALEAADGQERPRLEREASRVRSCLEFAVAAFRSFGG